MIYQIFINMDKLLKHYILMRFNYRVKLNHINRYGSPDRPFIKNDIISSIKLLHDEIKLLKIKTSFSSVAVKYNGN